MAVVRCPRTTRKRRYDFAEYRYLVEAAAAIEPRIELLVLLGGDAGLRRGEAIALEWTDVDLKDAAIRLLDRRPMDDRDAPADDNISRIKMAAADATPAPSGVKTVGDGLETSLRPEPESNPSV
jgi:integrase